MRLMAEIVQDRLQGPRILYDAWSAQLISDLDRCGLIPGTWLCVEWPERIIGAAKWIQMFRSAGFLTIPYGLPRPASPLTVYRGASAERMAGMSWTGKIDCADQFRQRQAWYASTAIYRTVVAPGAVRTARTEGGEPSRGRRRSDDAYWHRADRTAPPAARLRECM